MKIVKTAGWMSMSLNGIYDVTTKEAEPAAEGAEAHRKNFFLQLT